MSNINVNNLTPLSGTTGTVSVSGSLHVSGNISVTNGNLTGITNIVATSASVSYISSSSPTIFAGDIKPDTNDSNDIGSSNQQWKDLYLSGKATVNSASISKVSSSLVPVTELSNFDLGSSTNEWRDLHVDGTGNIDAITSSDVLVQERDLGTSADVFIHARTASLTVSGSDLTPIRFVNLPTNVGLAASIGTGSLWLSGSAGASSKFLVVYTG